MNNDNDFWVAQSTNLTLEWSRSLVNWTIKNKEVSLFSESKFVPFLLSLRRQDLLFMVEGVPISLSHTSKGFQLWIWVWVFWAWDFKKWRIKWTVDIRGEQEFTFPPIPRNESWIKSGMDFSFLCRFWILGKFLFLCSNCGIGFFIPFPVPNFGNIFIPVPDLWGGFCIPFPFLNSPFHKRKLKGNGRSWAILVFHSF